MSPEQAKGDLERLGPRSDVYSLGATLYCLLTGRPPFDGVDRGEVLRAVEAGDFPPPRLVDPGIDRAMEAVCLKAMAIRPDDRYASARGLADDIERWMADEPVTAWREPLGRRARRWARRNRTPVAAAAMALLAGVIGLGAVTAVQARANGRLRRAYAVTGEALAETRSAQAATQAALDQSEESRSQAEAVSNFLVDAFRRADPREAGRDIKVADLLDRAADRLGKEFAGSQATKGALLHTLGTTYLGLGLYDKAVTLLTSACDVHEAGLGTDHLRTLKSRHNLALAYGDAGRHTEAIALLEQTLERLESKLALTPLTRCGVATAWPTPIARRAARRKRSRCTSGRSSCAS